MQHVKSFSSIFCPGVDELKLKHSLTYLFGDIRQFLWVSTDEYNIQAFLCQLKNRNHIYCY